MIKDVLIDVYLLLFKIQYFLFYPFKVKAKIVFVASFVENASCVYREMKREQFNEDIIFLCRGDCIRSFKKTGEKTIPVETINVVSMLRSAYHLATAKVIIVDNYFGVLSAIRFKKHVRCIQLWHANGAFKTFGIEDRSIRKRSVRAHRRFLNVYNRFDKIIVGSEKMVDIFKASFHLSDAHFLRTGIPSTDIFFDAHKIENKRQLYEKMFAGKKVILYAPTFRDDLLNRPTVPLDLMQMKNSLGENYVLLLKLHPSVRSNIEIDPELSDFVIDCSRMERVSELLLGVSIVITDYSSIPFTFAILGRPIIFFAYDLDCYARKRGLQQDYPDELPGPVVRDTSHVIDCIKNHKFDREKIYRFSKVWNRYSTGHSSRNVVHYIRKTIDEYDKRFNESAYFSETTHNGACDDQED